MFGKISIFLLFLTAFISGCGTTQLIVMNNPSAEIFVNGEYKGNGRVEIKRTGSPKKSQVVAKYQGKEIGSVLVKRKFDFVTFMVGYCTYGIGFFTCWRYPEMVYIPTEDPKPFNNTYVSPWDVPPGNWNKK